MKGRSIQEISSAMTCRVSLKNGPCGPTRSVAIKTQARWTRASRTLFHPTPLSRSTTIGVEAMRSWAWQWSRSLRGAGSAGLPFCLLPLLSLGSLPPVKSIFTSAMTPSTFLRPPFWWPSCISVKGVPAPRHDLGSLSSASLRNGRRRSRRMFSSSSASSSPSSSSSFSSSILSSAETPIQDPAELKRALAEAARAIEANTAALNLPKIMGEIDYCEQEAAQESFWERPGEAREKMSVLAGLQGTVARVDRWRRQYEDVATALALWEEGGG